MPVWGISANEHDASLSVVDGREILFASHAEGYSGGKNDAINQAEKQDAINGVPVPSLAETKATAQDGFVFGLPIVMYYTSAYELFVDPTSSQYKAPIGQLTNEARVFTPKDTAVIKPNSDTNATT